MISCLKIFEQAVERPKNVTTRKPVELDTSLAANQRDPSTFQRSVADKRIQQRSQMSSKHVAKGKPDEMGYQPLPSTRIMK